MIIIASTPRTRMTAERAGDDLVIRRRTGPSWGNSAFLLCWMAMWTVVCVLLVARLVREPSPEHALFAIPFLVGWCGGLAVLLGLMLGFERFRVGPDGMEHGTLTGRRLVPLGEVKGIAGYSRTSRDEDGERTEHGLIVECSGRPIRFARGLDEADRGLLADRLIAHLREMDPDRWFDSPAERSEKPGAKVEVLLPGDPIPGPPSDGSIRLAIVRDGVRFVRRGSMNRSALAILTGGNLFWNGIVGVFALELARDFDWGRFLFLLPFAAVGLAGITCWILALLSPFVVERWAVGPREIAARWSFLGLGRTRRLDAEHLGRVELRRAEPAPDEQDDTPYALAFVGDDGGDRVVLDDLTEGEARWVGGVACDRLRDVLSDQSYRITSPPEGRATLWDREIDA